MLKERFHYGWVVVLACFLCCFSYGVFYSFGVFFKHLQLEFAWDRGLTSTIHSLHWICFPISSLVIGWLTDKYGPKWPLIGGATLMGLGIALLSQVQGPTQFYIFYALASLGAGVIWSLPTATVQRWFIKKRGLALGIVASGVGVGYVLSPLSSLLISNFGWRTAYLILGIGVWIILALATFLIAGSPEKKGLKPYGATEGGPVLKASSSGGWKASEAMRTSSFWLICGMHLSHLFAAMIIAVHLVNFATDIGIPEAQAAMAWFFVGLASVPGRITGGHIGERIGYRKIFIIFGVGNALMLLWLLRVESLWMLLFFVFLYGFFYGGQTPVPPVLLGQFFGLEVVATLTGTMMLTGMLSGTTAPFFAGFIFDKFGSYRIAFGTAAGFWALDALLAFRLRRPGREP